MSSIRLKQRTGSIKVKQRSGRIKQTNRKIIHKNYFGPDKAGYVRADVEILHYFDGYETVYKVDADANSSYEDIFTGQFITSDFPDYAGSNKILEMQFWAKCDEVPNLGNDGNWIENPSPDDSKYQRYVLQSDGQNRHNEYFRLYYSPESTALAYIRNVKVYKLNPPEYVFDT